MGFDREEKPLEDAELEMVVQVIRRGLKEGSRIEELEEKLAVSIGTIKECSKRLKELERIGQDVCRKYARALENQRKGPLPEAEALARATWIAEKSNELKAQLQ